MNEHLEYYKLIISVIGIVAALFVLFFRTWWDNNEKQNNDLKEDLIKLKFLSSQIDGSVIHIEKNLDSYKSIILAIRAKNYIVPERKVYLQFVIENIANINGIESYNYIFSKYYKEHYSEKFEDALFTKIITSYRWILNFEKDVTLRFEKAVEVQRKLNERLISDFYLLKWLIVEIIRNSENQQLRDDFNRVFMMQTTPNFNNYDPMYIYDNYIKRTMELAHQFHQNSELSQEHYDSVYKVYENSSHTIERFSENILNSFGDMDSFVDSIDAILINIRELSSQMEKLLKKIEQPVYGDFFTKLSYYISNQ